MDRVQLLNRPRAASPARPDPSAAPQPQGHPNAQPTNGHPNLAGCPVHQLKGMLRDAGLRPTRQRVALGWMLFGRGDRHVSAEALHEEALRARVPVSLATVYNTLHQFKDAGLLRQVAMEGSKTFFDTNTADHHHFFIEGEDRMIDIPGSHLDVANLPEAPPGMEIARVDVIVRVRRKA